MSSNLQPDQSDQTSQPSIIRAKAQFLVEHDFSVIPVSADKRPTIRWKKYQSQIVDQSELGIFNSSHMAVICGAVSGNLEVIDFDCHDPKNRDELDEIFNNRFMRTICENDEVYEAVITNICFTETPSGGYHFIARYDQPIGRHLTLAKWENGETMIETRGEGNYAIIPPSPNYHFILDRGLETLNPIPIKYRRFIHRLAREYTKRAEPIDITPPKPIATPKAKAKNQQTSLRAGDDYSENGDHHKLLSRHGWTLASTDNGTENWSRPGKAPKDGHSATWGHVAPRKFYVFSSNAQPLESDRVYDLFGLFARFEHGGDMKEATKALASQGFGAPTPPPPPQPTSTSASIATADTDLSMLTDTEGGLSRRLISLHGADMKWNEVWGKWLVWRGGRWEIDQSRLAMKSVEKLIRELLREASRCDDRDRRKQLTKLATSTDKISKIKSIVELMKQRLPILPDQLDKDQWLFNCQNGTIDLRSGELKEHQRSDFITKISPVTYDPNANMTEWEIFLEEVLPNREVREFMQRAVGYSLTGTISEQVLIILYGTGANGKSTFLEAIMHALGDYARTIDADLLVVRNNDSHPTSLADLMGVRFTSAVEISDGKRLNESMVKRLTGKDKIKARFMRKDFFEFDASHKLFYAVNHKPVVRGTDKGIWRRIRQVSFDQQFDESEQDPNLLEKLLKNRAGILRWAVEGCLWWQREGLGYPTTIRNDTEAYRQEMDQIGRFIEAKCITGDDENGREYKAISDDLYNSYTDWCDVAGERYKKSKNKFGRELTEREFSVDVEQNTRIRLGIGLINRNGDYLDPFSD